MVKPRPDNRLTHHARFRYPFPQETHKETRP